MRVWRWTLTAFVVVFLLAPLVVVAVGSVNENRYLNFPPEGYSLSWYAQLVTDTGWRPRGRADPRCRPTHDVPHGDTALLIPSMIAGYAAAFVLSLN